MTFIKLITSTMILFSANIAIGSGINGRYVCRATGDAIRQHGRLIPADATIYFQLSQVENHKYQLKNILGHASIGYFETPEGLDYTESGYGIFKINELTSNEQYRPTRYIGATQFRNFNATSSINYDGGGPWGSLVMELQNLSPNSKEFDAHYIFQHGDHMGGTMDLTCKRR